MLIAPILWCCVVEVAAPDVPAFTQGWFVAGLDQDQCIPRVHHILQAGGSGPSGLPQKEVEVPHSG